MPRSVLLVSIVVSIASLTFAQTSTPTNTRSTQTGVVTQTPSDTQIADAGRSPNVASDSDSLTPARSLPIANAVVVPTPQANSPLSEKNAWFEFDKRPRLKIFPQLNLNGAGFATFSQSIAAGIDFESKHFLLDGVASYNNAHKTNDGTGDNPKGHIRALDASAYYRLSNYWFIGTLAGWGQLSTTNYKKDSFGMSFGGGKDFIVNDASFRLSAAYAPSAFDHTNGSQGISFEFIEPSPLRQRHVMFVVDTSVQLFHATITDPNNATLTEQQKNNRSHSATSRFGLLFRF
jgi:hypothetical protein